MVAVKLVVMAVVVSPAPVTAIMAASAAIGLRFREEGRIDRRHYGPQPDQHVHEHVVPGQPDRAIDDLHGVVPVPQMPGKADELVGTVRPHLGEPFRCGDDAQHAAGVEGQPVAVAKSDRARKVQQEGFAGIVLEPHAAAEPVGMGQRHGAAGIGLDPGAGGVDANGASKHRVAGSG